MAAKFFEDSEQMLYVRKKLTGHNLLLGAAGTGKTSIALARLQRLAQNDIASKTVFITYTKTLKNACEDETLTSLAEQSHLFEAPSFEFRTFHKLFFDWFKTVKGRNPSIKSEPQTLVQQALEICKNREPSTEYNYDLERYVDEVKYIQEFDYPDLEAYQEATRIGRRVKTIYKNNRKYYWNIYQQYLKLLPDAKLNNDKRYYDCDFNGAALLFQKLLREHYPNGIYDHIIIDEGQDFPPSVVKAIRMLLKENGTLLFIGDATQEIYGSRVSWSSLGLKITAGKRTELFNNYRNTVEIGKFAIDILQSKYWDKNLKDVMYPQNMIEHGIKPLLIRFQDSQTNTQELVNFIKSFQEETFCFVTYHNEAAKQIQASLSRYNIKVQYLKDNIRDKTAKVVATTYYSIKGLDFDNVILTGFDENFQKRLSKVNDEDVETRDALSMKLFYVACTRAKKRLIIGYKNTLSELFPINSKNYEEIHINELVNYCKKYNSKYKNENSDKISKLLAVKSTVLNKQEMLKYLEKALKQASVELDIHSPWIGSDVVDEIFLDQIERLLCKGVIVKVLYGIQDDKNTRNKNKRSEKNAENLKLRFAKYKNFIMHKGNSHAKKLICDDTFAISGSLNWLSYNGKGERQEEGVLITDKDSIDKLRTDSFDF